MTARVNRIVVVLIVAFFAIALSACSGDAGQAAVNLYAAGAGDGSSGASHNSINYSPRLDGCGLGDRQQIVNLVDADLRAASESAGTTVSELPESTDTWLNNEMNTFGCIAAQ